MTQELNTHQIYLKVSHHVKMYNRDCNLLWKDACDEMTLEWRSKV